jgi:hypothetical protein
MGTNPKSVCPELVEGPFFFLARRQKKERSLDKLRTNGEERA